MENPEFRFVEPGSAAVVTYACGCSCQPAAAVADDGSPGFEHCCCGKVHFAGAGAEAALTAYLAERKTRRRREPEYTRGRTTLAEDGRAVEVAWAFPAD